MVGEWYDINMRNTTTYEWTCEVIVDDENPDYQDIVDSDFGDSLEEVQRRGESNDIEGTICRYGLVKNVGNEDDGLQERTWAYVDENGKLPEEFENGDKVPKRFRV